jgi:hypothetical protein
LISWKVIRASRSDEVVSDRRDTRIPSD